MALPTASDNEFPKVILEEVANDGSATVTPAADHRALFLGEDGGLHLKDSAAAVTDIVGASAHIADTSDAHDASAVSVLDTAANFTGTDVEAVLAELQDNIDAIPGTHVTFTIGPYLINDLPGTATTQLLLPFLDTGTTIKFGTNGVEYRIPVASHVIGAILTSDNARTAGTATLQVRVGGTPTAFAAGAVVLDGTNTTRASAFVAHASGVAAAANSSVGVAIVTSGWTPTTANINAQLIISLD